MNGKCKTAYGYTETHEGHVPHKRIVGIFGIPTGCIEAPVCIEKGLRDNQGLPFAKMIKGVFVYALPGGKFVTADGKTC